MTNIFPGSSVALFIASFSCLSSSLGLSLRHGSVKTTLTPSSNPSAARVSRSSRRVPHDITVMSSFALLHSHLFAAGPRLFQRVPVLHELEHLVDRVL